MPFETNCGPQTTDDGYRAITIAHPGQGKIPTNLRSFLRDNDNETELFNFLNKIVEMGQQNTVIVTREEGAGVTIEGMVPCNHGEAVLRIFVHARHARANRYIYH